ncbi:MAG: hypothetical protein ABIS47_09290 [Acidimicrobiales bacterium]
MATIADAANGADSSGYNPETAAGYTNTYSTKTTLTPQCPNALAATPGSDPASKVLNSALNTPASFQPGGTVHFTYLDNPHTNAGTQNFTIQDCVVTYPAGTFRPGQVDPVTGAVTDYAKNDLKGGTQIAGASLSGISSSVGNIYYSWTAPTTPLAAGSFVCFFARDIANNHGGDGNRKVPPTCYQVPGPPLPPTPTADTPPDVRVAYVDDLHSMSNPPSPWQGDPGVVYVGCTDGASNCGEIDGGAIRIDNINTNGNALTLTAASVDIGACHFDPWSGTPTTPSLLPTLVAQGGSLILTQTGQLGAPMPAPCRDAINPTYWPFTNFDTSERPGDNGGFSGTRLFNCDVSTGVAPVIHLTFSNGMNLTITDANKVLNTGGIDSQACFGVNEGAPWTTTPLPYTP